jgi:hypothetical protein
VRVLGGSVTGNNDHTNRTHMWQKWFLFCLTCAPVLFRGFFCVLLLLFFFFLSLSNISVVAVATVYETTCTCVWMLVFCRRDARQLHSFSWAGFRHGYVV